MESGAAVDVPQPADGSSSSLCRRGWADFGGFRGKACKRVANVLFWRKN